MDEISAVFSHFPAWAGSVPMWGLLAAVLVTLIKIWPTLRQQTIDEKLNIRDRYLARIKELVQEIKDCRTECQEQDIRLTGKIDVLQTQINNEALQRVQSEISLVHTLLEVVDAPQLQQILAALEKRKTLLPSTAAMIGRPEESSDEGRD